MISPTPGRIVWFFPSIDDGRDPNGQPLGAMIAKVLDERTINLTVSHGDGSTYARQGVQLLQDDDAAPDTAYACWMPYQKGQAAKHDTPAPALQLESVHQALDTLATGAQSLDAKVQQIGELTLAKLTEFDARLTAHEKPAETPPPHQEPPPNGQPASV